MVKLLPILLLLALCVDARGQGLSLIINTLNLGNDEPEAFDWDCNFAGRSGPCGTLNLSGRTFYSAAGGVPTLWMLSEIWSSEYDEELEEDVLIAHTIRVRVSLIEVGGLEASQELYIAIEEIGGGALYAGPAFYDVETGDGGWGMLIDCDRTAYPFLTLQLNETAFDFGGGGSGGSGGGFPGDPGPAASEVEADDSGKSAVEDALEESRPTLPTISPSEFPDFVINTHKYTGNGGLAGLLQEGSPTTITLHANPNNAHWGTAKIATFRTAVRAFLVVLMMWGTFDYILKVLRQW